MKIVLMEPLGISAEKLAELSSGLTAAGHEFTAYDTVETDAAKMIERAKDADILMIANHPLPDEVISACPRLQYISVAFVGIDNHVVVLIRTEHFGDYTAKRLFQHVDQCGAVDVL